MTFNPRPKAPKTIKEAKRSSFKRPEYKAPPRAPLAKGRKVDNGPASTAPAPKEPKPIRDETYRRLVAALPCFECRVEGFSQAAHPNSDKAKGRKQSDLDCFPLCCTRPGVPGCHAAFDQYKLIERAAMPAYEARAKEWTQTMIRNRT